MKKQNLITRFFKMKESPKAQAQSTQDTMKEMSKNEEEEKFPDQKLDTDHGIDLKDLQENFRDGRRIFQNRLKCYPKYRPDMLKFTDLLDEYLSNPDFNPDEKESATPENIVFTTFVSEDSYLAKTIVNRKIE